MYVFITHAEHGVVLLLTGIIDLDQRGWVNYIHKKWNDFGILLINAGDLQTLHNSRFPGNHRFTMNVIP
jgi:hypothetical protein